jgi:hypothetical protein
MEGRKKGKALTEKSSQKEKKTLRGRVQGHSSSGRALA